MVLDTNISSTDSSYFQIGKSGVTLYQGKNVPLDTLGNSGDVYFNIGTEPKIFIKDNMVWKEVGSGSATKFALIDDPNPTLGADLIVNGFKITSNNNGNISIIPDEDGKLILNSLVFPKTKGLAGQVLKSDGAGNILWANEAVGIRDITNAGDETQGQSIISSKVSDIYYLKRILAGNNITLRTTQNSIIIDSSLENIKDASTTVKGIIQLATLVEAKEGLNTVKAITPATLVPTIKDVVDPIIDDKIIEVLAGELPEASTTVKGIIQLATLVEAKAGTNATKAITPATLVPTIKDVVDPIIDDKIIEVLAGELPEASTTKKGIIQIATLSEAKEGLNTVKAITPATLVPTIKDVVDPIIDDKIEESIQKDIPDASTTVKGIIQIATLTEAKEGLNTVKAITPATLIPTIDSITNTIVNEKVLEIITEELPEATTTVKGIVRLATKDEFKQGTSSTIALTPASLSKGKNPGDLVIVNADGKIDPTLYDGGGGGIDFDNLDFATDLSYEDQMIIKHEDTVYKATINRIKSIVRSNIWWQQGQGDTGTWYPEPLAPWSSEYIWLASFSANDFANSKMVDDIVTIDRDDEFTLIYDYTQKLNNASKIYAAYDAKNNKLGWYFNINRKFSSLIDVGSTDGLEIKKTTQIDNRNIQTLEFVAQGVSTDQTNDPTEFVAQIPSLIIEMTGSPSSSNINKVLCVKGEVVIDSAVPLPENEGCISLDIFVAANIEDQPLYKKTIELENFGESTVIDAFIPVSINMDAKCFFKLNTISGKEIFVIMKTRGFAMYYMETTNTNYDFIIPSGEYLNVTSSVNSLKIKNYTIPQDTDVLSISFQDGSNVMIPYNPEIIGEGVILPRDIYDFERLDKSSLFISRIDALKFSTEIDEYEVLDVWSFYGKENNYKNMFKTSALKWPIRFFTVDGELGSDPTNLCYSPTPFITNYTNIIPGSSDVPIDKSKSGLILCQQINIGYTYQTQPTNMPYTISYDEYEGSVTFASIYSKLPLTSQKYTYSLSTVDGSYPVTKASVSFAYEINNEKNIIDKIEIYDSTNTTGSANIEIPLDTKKGIMSYVTNRDTSDRVNFMISLYLKKGASIENEEFLKLKYITTTKPKSIDAPPNYHFIGVTDGSIFTNFGPSYTIKSSSIPENSTNARIVFLDNRYVLLNILEGQDLYIDWQKCGIINGAEYIKRIEFVRKKQ